MLKVRCKACSGILTAGIEKIYCSCGNVFCDPINGDNFNAGWIATGKYDDNMELLNEDETPFGPLKEVESTLPDIEHQSVIE